MSETKDMWHHVLSAFEDWIDYEASGFGPWTGYFSIDNLRDLTDDERLAWMRSMCDEIIPGRVEKCRTASVALEDFLPYMPDPDTIETVRSMIELSSVIEHAMLRQSDMIFDMMEEYSPGGLDEIVPYLSSLSEAEEDIRHHMSLFSQGFGRLKTLGLDISDDLA